MKKVALGIIFIISLIIINNLARSIYNLWQKQELVVITEKELEREKKLNEQLKKQGAAVKDPRYIEEVARDKLFLAKPKEQVVIMPPENEKKGRSKGKENREFASLEGVAYTFFIPHWRVKVGY